MANIITNYFAINKPGSVRPLRGKKGSASGNRFDKSSASCVTEIQDSCPSKCYKSKDVVDKSSLHVDVKSCILERESIDERIKTPTKRKINSASPGAEQCNSPKKLHVHKMTTNTIIKESVNPQASCTNGEAENDALRRTRTNSSSSKLKLLKPEKIEKLRLLKKRINSIRKELEQPVLLQEELAPAISSSSSVSSKPEISKTKSKDDAVVPAFRRFADFVSKDAETKLVLPNKFKVLAESFRCLDHCVSLAFNRQQICYFVKVKSAVEDIMRRKFDLVHLGQIKTVFPAAYHLQHEKLRVNRAFSGESHLTIAPNMNCFSKDGQSSNFDKEQAKPHTIIKQKDDSERSKEEHIEKMKPSFLLARKNAFNSELMTIVECFHKDFLAALDPPIILDKDERISRWHPKFILDGVPDIVPSELPKPAGTEVCPSAMDVLRKIKGLYGQKVDDVLPSAAKSDTVQNEINETLSKASSQLPDSVLNGIPLDLLAKIRAKEAAKIKADMTRKPEADLRLQMLSRLPDMARILKNLFISEKKAALSISDACNKISANYVGSVNPEDMEKHLHLLKELAPDWLYFREIRAGVYLKVNKTVNFNDVLSKIESAQKLSALA